MIDMDLVSVLIEYSEWLLVLLGGGAGVYGWQALRRIRRRTKKWEDKQEDPYVASPIIPEAVVKPTPTKKKTSFSSAIQSWIPLLNEKSKDKEKWEEVLILSDMGPRLTDELVEGLAKSDREPADYLKTTLKELIRPAEADSEPWKTRKPWVLFVVGVNGVGKTTSLVKLSRFFKSEGKSIGVVGADTFRKAAIEQLGRGCESVGADFFTHKRDGQISEGADPSAVIFDGLKHFADRDIILVDTSGRLHHKTNLMEELKKMKRVADKSMPGAPHESWLIVDATLGQNAVDQAKAFHEAIGLCGLVLTKMDGVSRGGTIFQLFQSLKLPIRFLGVGEKPEDLQKFSSDNFVDDLFDRKASYS